MQTELKTLKNTQMEEVEYKRDYNSEIFHGRENVGIFPFSICHTTRTQGHLFNIQIKMKTFVQCVQNIKVYDFLKKYFRFLVFQYLL